MGSVSMLERNFMNQVINSFQNKKILLVEDSPTQAARIKLALEEKGLEVSIAQTGEAALTLAMQSKPNLIVLDANLPGLDGFEVCGFLKSNLTTRLMPVVMYSEESKLSLMTKAYSVGVDYYITKDAAGERALLAIIENLLERQARRRGLYAPEND